MSISVEEFLDNITQHGLEYYGVYPGWYRAIVTNVTDPQNRFRIQARVPAIQERALNKWIKPSFMGAGPNRGGCGSPSIGDAVYVSFAQGNPSRPEFYLGGWFAYPREESDAPDELKPDGAPNTYGFVTRMGHSIKFLDDPDSPQIDLVWNKPNSGDEARTDDSKTASRPGSVAQGGGTAHLKFNASGGIELKANGATDSKIVLSSDKIELIFGSSKIILDSTGVEVDASIIKLGSRASEPLVKGTSLLNWLLSHTHPSSTGPTGTPTVPPTSAMLNSGVKV